MQNGVVEESAPHEISMQQNMTSLQNSLHIIGGLVVQPTNRRIEIVRQSRSQVSVQNYSYQSVKPHLSLYSVSKDT